MSNASYLAHFGTKGQKHGLRRHQSYETAPTRSGMVGQEVGEAARQSERLNRRNEQDDRNGPRRGPVQYEAKPTYNSPSDLAKASKKQTLREKLRAKKAEKEAKDIEKNKAKWATNYKDLEKHKDAFTNRELEYALNRLNLTDRIKSDRWEQTRNLTQKGADTMRNLANASKSFVDIYNVVAGGYNTYQNYKSNKANKIDLMPKWNASSGTYNINNQNKSNNNNNNNKGGNKPNFNGNKNLKKKFKHSGMSAKEYIAHFGIPGQKKGIRNFQSYDTAPTRSGMVGEERGLAAKQAARLAKQERNDQAIRERWVKESDKYYSKEEAAHDKRADKFLKKATDTTNEKKALKYAKKWYDETASKRNIEKIHKYANEHILSMTHDEIKKEKRQRGVDVLMDIGGVAAGFAMTAAGAPVAVYTFGAGRARQKNRRTKNALDYYKKKHGEDMTFDKIYHSNMSSDEYIAHFGVPGQRWYHRFFQSYKTAPTRSGKVGEEHGLANAQAENKTDEATDKETQLKALQESNRKTLESAGFKDTTPAWYNNYASTRNVKQYSIEMHDPANDGHSDGVKRTNALLDVDDNCYEPQIKAAVDFSKNFEKHDATIKDAIVESYFSSPNNVPWLYEKGYADELPLGKRFIEGKSFEEQKKFFRDHLGIRADTSKDKNAFSTGGKDIVLERGGISGKPDDCIASVYYSDGGAYFGHVFTALIDLKTGKVYEVSMGG